MGPNADAEMLRDDDLAISYQTDNAALQTLRVTTGDHFLMDAYGAEA
jgi:hypothetical protein